MVFCALVSLVRAQPQKPVIFPSITSSNLEKQKVTLPSGLEGQTNLLILWFAPEQQKAVDSWMPAAQALQHSNFSFRYYEIPVQERENFLFRWWAVSSMKSDQTDPESWHWVVPIFVNRQKLLRQLDIPNKKQVVVLLIDRQGRVLWRADGPLTQEKRQSLMAATGSH